jgi:hypothetical protein
MSPSYTGQVLKLTISIDAILSLGANSLAILIKAVLVESFLRLPLIPMIL